MKHASRCGAPARPSGRNDSFEIETNASLLGIWSGLSNTFFMATIGIAVCRWS